MDLQEALITFCAKSMCFAVHMFLRVHQGVAHIIDLIEDSRGNTRDCAHPLGVCAFVSMRVRHSVFCVLFLLSTVLRQNPDCFKWGRQLQIVDMY